MLKLFKKYSKLMELRPEIRRSMENINPKKDHKQKCKCSNNDNKKKLDKTLEL